jgi:A/G-specific adenine glycosylase
VTTLTLVPAVQASVLEWGLPRLRDLPWRATRDPWSVLVSEVMLQQTQVARVVPRYLAFMERFPTVEVTAATSVGDVLRCWNGLGYNNRAVRLHRAAIVVVREHDGRFPTTLELLRRLPGVGPYTARAVMAFAFEADAAVVDTNIARTLARWHGRRLGPAEVQRLADDALPSGDAWAWNQALMELGATVCTARTPACERCPLAITCRWQALGGPDPAVGSAGVAGRQSRFAGSDRQGRGHLVRSLTGGPVAAADLARAMGWPDDPERAVVVAAACVADGLVVLEAGRYRLP